jgi:hypothetical protein
MPFALNEATRYISPTKTPEFLAAGLPVVSSAVTDVVTTYGDRGLVSIAVTAEDFNAGVEQALASAREERLAVVDALLATMSWDRTWAAMHTEMQRVRKPSTRKLALIEAGANYAGV